MESWQADPDGRFDHPDDPRGPGRRARGLPRLRPQRDRRAGVRTGCAPSSPARCPSRTAASQAPHLDVSVFARGLLHRVVTRLYFPDEPAANAADPVLALASTPTAVATLLAQPPRTGSASTSACRATDETVFFAV